MPEPSLLDLGELSKPATVLIEKIAEATGILFEPIRIERRAKADAKALMIKAGAEIEITELQRRAAQRFFQEEGVKQRNMERILKEALPQLKEGADPRAVEDGWIANFFDRSRLVSDGEMQNLWSYLLAGEMNSPGKYSVMAINLLATLSKSDAVLFNSLSSFAWTVQGKRIIFVYDPAQSICSENGLNFARLKHLDALRLISFESLSGYALGEQSKYLAASYHGSKYKLEMPQEENNSLPLGHVILSQWGEELLDLCQTQPIFGFEEYVVSKWEAEGIKITKL